MGPTLAGVSGNKGRAQSSFVLGKLPLSRELLSCRFPFNLRLLSRVWVRGEADLADPSHETPCYQGQQWRTAAQFRSDFCARSLLPVVSATSQSGKDLRLSILSWWAEQMCKQPASGTRPITQSVSGSLSSVPQRSDTRQPPAAVAPTPTSSLLMGTEGCRRFPISRRLSNRSASSFTRSASHFRMASSMRSRSFLICDTFRFCR